MTPVIEHEFPESWMNIFLISIYICFQAIWRLELINKAIKTGLPRFRLDRPVFTEMIRLISASDHP